MYDLDEYLGAIACGDHEAFASWVAGAEQRLRLSLASFATTVDTEAVVQETLLRTWQVAPRVRPDGRPDALLRLAVRIARNLAIDEQRRSRVRPVHDEDLERAAAAWAEAPAMPDPLLRRLIQACRELLPERPARALALRLANRGARPDAELAAEAGMKLNTFLQNVTRARKSLVDCLEGRGVRLGGLT